MRQCICRFHNDAWFTWFDGFNVSLAVFSLYTYQSATSSWISEPVLSHLSQVTGALSHKKIPPKYVHVGICTSVKSSCYSSNISHKDISTFINISGAYKDGWKHKSWLILWCFTIFQFPIKISIKHKTITILLLYLCRTTCILKLYYVYQLQIS